MTATALEPAGRLRDLALRAAVGGGTIGGLAAGWALLLSAEARLARRTIGEPTAHAPDPAGTYGRARTDGRRRSRPLHLTVIGDSSAAGLGVDHPEQTPGALLAGGLARDLRRRVVVDVVARTGARSADLDVQVGRALRRPVDLAVILIGANDVTHRTPVATAVRDLARAVRTLRAAGAVVVVGTCPDLGTVKPLLQPLRFVARRASRRMAAAQAVAVVEADGIAVSLGDLLAREFTENPALWSADRFHPSPAGYRRLVDALLPSLLEAGGVQVPVSVPVSESVQDVAVAAAVAASEPGLVVETLPGDSGAASEGPGRLARLRRRLPLVGRGAPEARDPDAPEEPEARDPVGPGQPLDDGADDGVDDATDPLSDTV